MFSYLVATPRHTDSHAWGKFAVDSESPFTATTEYFPQLFTAKQMSLSAEDALFDKRSTRQIPTRQYSLLLNKRGAGAPVSQPTTKH